MAKVYLLTTGEYSAYSIHSIYSSLEKLNEAKKKLENPDAYNQFNEPEEFELDEYGKDGRWPYTVHIEGPSIKCELERSSYNNECNFVRYNQLLQHGDYIHYWTTVMAEDEQHAIKIASDLIAQYKDLNNLGE